MYCFVFPAKSLQSRSTCDTWNPMNSHTASKVISPSFSLTAASSFTSTVIRCTPSGRTLLRLPLFMTQTSQSSSFTSLFTIAVLMVPVPPINNALFFMNKPPFCALSAVQSCCPSQTKLLIVPGCKITSAMYSVTVSKSSRRTTCLAGIVLPLTVSRSACTCCLVCSTARVG